MSRGTCSFFMSKILIIIFLSISIFLSYGYLQTCLENRKGLSFETGSKALLLHKKEIILNDRNDFLFDDYFTLLTFREEDVDYFMDEDTITILLDDREYVYPYQIREKETVEMVVYKEIFYEEKKDDKPKEQPVETPQQPQTVQSYSNETQEHYLILHKTSVSYPLNTDISEIISDLSSCFESNANVLIDFSMLNCSATGSYPVYFNYDDQQKEIIVSIA